MNGEELRQWRLDSGMYQAQVAAALKSAGVRVEGLKLDQPTVSEMERGKIDVPPEVAEAIAGGLLAEHAAPSNQKPPPDTRAKSRSRKEPAAREEEPAPPPVEEPPAEPAPEPDAVEPPAGDRPPRPLPTTRTPTFDAAVRSQLEADLRKLFAGDSFLVPVEVRDATGERRIVHEEAAIPGVAQVVGILDPYDGEVVAMHAAAMARAWADLAAENVTVRRLLMALTYGGAWRGVVAATFPVVYAIGVHHGALPPMFGGSGAAPPPLEPTPAHGEPAPAV